MRLANRALIAALATLMLCAVVSAQTLRLPEDPRNQSPAVGTGGPEGGPTGLFTIYDGSTIRRGEFTFSVAYSNFDRDPGDVDIVETPLSFNVGLNDHIELFFKTNGYRGVKVNSPTNLSSFYLPNTQLFFGAALRCSGGAIIQAPDRVTGATGIVFGSVVRPPGPPCNVGGQGFVQFPFVGQPGPNFGLTGNLIAPPYTSRLGVPTGGNGSYGAASNFPGIGSPVGSILPGIVLAQRTIPANLTFNTLTVPNTFTIAPSYLPDAPFISRLYGESAFGNMVVGAKIRLASPTHAVGYGLIPFYRWYLDNANDAAGFNQMQRGAGPGAQLGDFGLIGFFDARLSQHVNVSLNAGYILNSNPKSSAMGNNAVLLDRPDEALFGIGFDFPINKYFQIIGEARATKYMGGRTPNAFNNNPVDVIGGVKIYPARWWGIGAAYRRHMNPQDADRFGGALPGGFRPSEDPNGFIGQFWIGHRNARTLPPPPNQAPTVTVSASTASITTPCPPGTSSDSCTPSSSRTVDLTANAADPDNDTLLYTWSVTGGTLSGDGRAVAWDLSGVNVGTYTATVTVNDGNNHTVTASTTVSVAECTGCVPPCPTVSVSCPSDVDEGQPVTITASVNDSSITYNWSVSAGTITSGQGTSTITVDTAGLGGQTVTATLEVGGLAPSCSRTASCSTSVRAPNPPARKFDEYGDIRFNDEKARLDNYAIELQNAPGSTGTIVVFGNCAGAGQARGDRAKDYLVNTRGIDAARLTVVDGGCREELVVELWIVPTGAAAPTPTNTATVDPCPECKKKATPRRRRGRRD